MFKTNKETGELLRPMILSMIPQLKKCCVQNFSASKKEFINQPSPTPPPSYYMSMVIKVILIPGRNIPGEISPNRTALPFSPSKLRGPHRSSSLPARPCRSDCIIHNPSWYLSSCFRGSGGEVALKARLQNQLTCP